MKKFLLFTLSVFLIFLLASCTVKGADGKTPYIQDGFWYIDGVNTGVKAAGVDGSNGKDGIDGKDGVGIEKIEIDSDGNFVVTFTNGTTQIVAPQNQKEENSTQEKQETKKTYDEIILILESAFANAKGQNYWNIKTTVGENTVSEYNKDNSPSQEFIDALFDIHHDQLVLGQVLSECKQSNFILTTIGGQITITTTDCPKGVSLLTFVIDNELIKSYSFLVEGIEYKSTFTYEE